MRLVPDNHNKMNITINGVTQIFGFLVHIKSHLYIYALPYANIALSGI